MRALRTFALFALFSCCLPAAEYGPAIGSRMPAFDLKDQSGKAHTLESLLGPKGAVIVFFRSADW
ncbi:MAG TPA: hypothetical protein VMB25_00385 [Bryobacteraceae bacterium]|nr:hypothetical protein [Bryobacteraceae bacterium]